MPTITKGPWQFRKKKLSAKGKKKKGFCFIRTYMARLSKMVKYLTITTSKQQPNKMSLYRQASKNQARKKEVNVETTAKETDYERKIKINY